MIKESYGRKVNVTTVAIELLTQQTDNKVFKTARFRRALIDYRRFGMKPIRKTGWTLTDALYYAKHSHSVHEHIKRCASIS